jgi:hypothetical protein
MSKVQSVVFVRADDWPYEDRRAFLSRHNLQPIKRVHITPTQYRYRIHDPRDFDRFITKRVISHGGRRKGKRVLLIIGFPTKSGSKKSKQSKHSKKSRSHTPRRSTPTYKKSKKSKRSVGWA